MGSPYLLGTAASSASATAVTITNGAATTAGDAIIVAASNSGFPGGTAVTSVADSAGNAYALKTSTTTDFTMSMWLADASNNPGGPDPLPLSGTITVNYAAANTNAKSCLAAAVTGYSGTDVIPSPAGGTSGSTMSISSGTLANSNEVIFTAFCNANGGGIPSNLQNCSSLGTANLAGTQYLTLAYDIAAGVSASDPGLAVPGRARPGFPQLVSSLPSVTASAHIASSTSRWAVLEFSMTVAAGPAVPAQASLTPSAAMLAVGTASSSYTVLQQVPGSAQNVYGFSSVNLTTTQGSTLVLYAGWNTSNKFTNAPVPVAYVEDNAHNMWTHLGTSDDSGFNSRCSVWVCTNAQAIAWLSCSLTTFATSLAYLLVEFSGMPQYLAQDVTGTANIATPLVQQLYTASGSWQAPPLVNQVYAECWGAGGGGGGSVQPGGFGSGGGAGGEYAAEPVVGVTPGSFYAVAVGAGGTGVSNANGTGGTASSFIGDVLTVQAHGGQRGTAGSGTAEGGAGGSGSTNAIHFTGGAGGSNPQANYNGGAGGGSSASASGAGTHGNVPAGNRGAPGAIPPSGGGIGGGGGNALGVAAAHNNGYPGLLPGGGGGGGGEPSAGGTGFSTGGGGGGGQVLLTYGSVVSLTVPSTAAAVQGIGFTMVAAGYNAVTITTPPSWQPLAQVSAGSGPGSVKIAPYWNPNVPAGTSLTATFGLSSGAAPLSGTTASIASSPPVPVLVNPSFPLLKVEMAFGALPGDPTAAPPSWTDVTTRCITRDGDAFIETSAGREYELITPEAGELTIMMDNHDGAFTPGNALSPYFPNVMLGTPVRVTAFWQGQWYRIAFGYVERWPQEWPDLPQYGFSKMVATDAVAVLTSAVMPSALSGDILIDNPYAYFHLDEQYFSEIQGLLPGSTQSSGSLNFFQETDAQGLIAINKARGNQRPAYYANGMSALAGTGQALSLLGDAGTGMGTGSISVAPTGTGSTGPGVIYYDPGMPSLGSSGITPPPSFNVQAALSPAVGFTVNVTVTNTNQSATAALSPQAALTAAGLQTQQPLGPVYLMGSLANNAGTTTVVVPVINGVTSGKQSIVVSTSTNDGSTATKVTDSQLNTYVLSSQSVTGTLHLTQWTCLSPATLAGGASTITVTYPGTGGAHSAIAVAFPHCVKVDQVPAVTSSTSTSPSVTSGTLALANEYDFAVLVNSFGGGAPAWNASWTSLNTVQTGTNQYMSVAWFTRANTTAVTASATILSAGWQMGLTTVQPTSTQLYPIFGINTDMWNTIEAVLGTMNTAKMYNTSTSKTTWPGNAIAPGTSCTHPYLTSRIGLTGSAPYISSADQSYLASLFANIPKTGHPVVGINQEADQSRFGYTAAQVAGSTHQAYKIFQQNAPANALFCQNPTTYAAFSRGVSNWKPFICCAANGQVDLPLYLIDWYPNTTSSGAVSSIGNAYTGITQLIKNPKIGIAECNYTSNLSGGITYSGGPATWMQDAWNWSVSNNMYLFIPYYYNAHGVPWPPDTTTQNELKSYAKLSLGSPATP